MLRLKAENQQLSIKEFLSQRHIELTGKVAEEKFVRELVAKLQIPPTSAKPIFATLATNATITFDAFLVWLQPPQPLLIVESVAKQDATEVLALFIG